MTDLQTDDELDLLAAELSLGILDSPERLAVSNRLQTDSEFERRVARWQAKLNGMLDDIPAVEPNEAIWARLQSRLFDTRGELVVLKQRAARWRRYGVAITGLAASLAVFAVFDRPVSAPVERPSQPRLFAAAIATEQGPVAATVSFDQGSGRLAITPVTIQPVADQDFELWLVPANSPPTSLGLVAANGPSRLKIPSAIGISLRNDAVLAISAEPRGGSPTALPSGPIVATGKLFAI